MTIEKYIIDKSDLTALLRGETLAIQPKGNIKGFCVEIAGNLTNGDVIKAIFSDNVFAEEKWQDENGEMCTDMISDNGMTFTDIWWNAPYRAESEG